MPEVTSTWLGRVDYAAGLRLQEEAHARVLASGSGEFLLLEHEPVYTIGRTRDRSSLIDESSLPHPVVEINRGGQATYHGPGQLVGYLIVDLNLYGRDLHAFLRALEEGLIRACDAAGFTATRREGLTGVWVENRKIASIGVGVRKWVTMHGFAINVTADLSGFASIVPCGIGGVTMTSVANENGEPAEVEHFSQLAAKSVISSLEEIAS
jgi:lipoyl(octanoyl) transferase